MATLRAWSGRSESPPDMLTAALESNERLIWWDRPGRGLVLRSADAFLIPFSLVWVSIPSIGVFSTFRSAAPSPISLVPFLFVAAGLYLLVGRFFYDAWRRARTVYGSRPYRSTVEMQEHRSRRHQRGQPESAPQWHGFDHLRTRVRDLRSTRRRNLGRRTRGADTRIHRRAGASLCRDPRRAEAPAGKRQRPDGWRTCQRCGVARPWAPR
jgi:hypothetical protein